MPEAAPPAPDLLEVLRARFDLPEFRPGQREAIEGVLYDPRRVLLVAPTGGGKSLTYQLPATVLPGLTVVLSPLIALMEDQVRSLHARGIEATYVASSLEPEERRARERDVERGRYRILYCAPERLASEAFVAMLARCDVSLVAIDEAHCIAQWGHDFRPDYLRIGAFLERTRPPRVLACTATATPRVREEIKAQLGLVDALELVRGFARPNLHLSARAVEGPKEARTHLFTALGEALDTPRAPKGAAIVYCATRKATEATTKDLRARGWNAATYHAGLAPEVRADVNARFATGKLDVVAATNAFGMGIDRADVRLVVHAQPPASLEAYYQEVGRAGRDGDPAYGLLLCSPMDVAVRRRLCELGSDGPAAPEAAARAWALFRELLRYLDAGSCRHDFVLRYFGDERELLGGCGHCDVCAELDDAEEEGEVQGEGAMDVRKALAGVARADRRGGLVSIAEMLHGDRTDKVTRFGFDELTTFGLLSARPQEWIVSLLRALLAAGWIDLTPNDHPVPFVTRAGGTVMRSEGPVRLRLPTEKTKGKRARPDRAKRGSVPPPTGDEGALFEALRAHRAEVAKRRRVPAYVVAQDATLLEIARRKPTSEEGLLACKGMGPYRVEKYGEGILSVVRAIG